MRSRLLCPLLCAAFALLGVPAQTAAPYRLNVVVTDGKGHPVANLPSGSFSLQSNGHPVPLQSAQPAAGAPAKVLLVIDAINVDYTRVAYEREQIDKYLSAGDGTLSQPTAISVVADTSTEQTPGFTVSGNALRQTLDGKTIALRDLRRSAGFYGAQERLDLSLKALGSLLASVSRTPGHTLILWISPGWPLLSGPGVQLSNRDQQGIYRELAQLTAAIHSADATLYSINPLGTGEDIGRENYYEQFEKGVRKPSRVQIGNLGLQVLALQSGGLALNGSNDITRMLQQCTAEAQGAYTLTFIPPVAEPDTDYQQLDVRVTDVGLKARTTQGIYLVRP